MRPGWLRRGSVGRRLLWVVGCWALACVVLSLMSYAPSVPLLAAVSLVLAVGAAVVGAPTAGTAHWADDLPSPALARGSDHQTMLLAARMATVDQHPDRRDELARDVRDRLVAALVARVRRTRGVDLAVEPHRAAAVLPPDLAGLVVETGPPATPVLDPDVLAGLLTRIEAL